MNNELIPALIAAGGLITAMAVFAIMAGGSILERQLEAILEDEAAANIAEAEAEDEHASFAHQDMPPNVVAFHFRSIAPPMPQRRADR
jgi:hydroxyethylthiazole kinase-like sugar kinase family protein